MIENRYLILRAPDFTGRVITAQRRPHLRRDEVCYRLRLEIPDGWGHVTGLLTIELPEPPVAHAELVDGGGEETSMTQ